MMTATFTHDRAAKFRKLQKGLLFMTYRDKRALLRAVSAGTAVAGAPWLLITTPAAISVLAPGNIATGVFVLVTPILVAGALVLTGMLVIGLPLTAVLSKAGKECRWVFGLLGAIIGFLLPAAVAIAFDDSSEAWIPAIALAFNGMFAGAATGFVWGKHRKRIRDEAQNPDPTNPIHELIY